MAIIAKTFAQKITSFAKTKMSEQKRVISRNKLDRIRSITTEGTLRKKTSSGFGEKTKKDGLESSSLRK